MRVSRARNDGLGVVVWDVQTRRLDEDEARIILNLVYEHALVVFRDQNLTTEEFVRFARRLGPLDTYLQEHYHHPEFPEVFVSSNEIVDGKPIGVARTGNYWHSDGAFLPTPYPLTMLYPQKLPSSGRETLFVHMGEVYDRLPADLRAAVQGTTATQDCKWRYKVRPRDAGHAIVEILEAIEKACPSAAHPTVIRHPVTRRELLYVSSGFTTGIRGKTNEESSSLLAALFDFSTLESRVHRHTHAPGEIMLWDNRQLIHRSGDVAPGETSTTYRVNPNDQQPFYIGQARAA
jgi:taurine dioxygenase